MGTFNVVTTGIVCAGCQESPVRVQFKYAKVWQHEYVVGDRVTWGRRAAGLPGATCVAVDGIAETCPRCGYDEEQYFYVFVEQDVITRVVHADGSLDFVGTAQGFIVL